MIASALDQKILPKNECTQESDFGKRTVTDPPRAVHTRAEALLLLGAAGVTLGRALAELAAPVAIAVRRGNALWRIRPNGLFQVSKGLVQGQRAGVSLGLAGPDDVIGDACLVAGTSQASMAVAITDVEGWFWPVAVVDEWREAIEGDLLRLCAARCACLEEQVARGGWKVIERLAQWLWEYAVRFGTAREDGWYVCPAMPQRAIAVEFGTSRELVTVSMGAMARAGLADWDRQMLRVHREIVRAGGGLC